MSSNSKRKSKKKESKGINNVTERKEVKIIDNSFDMMLDLIDEFRKDDIDIIHFEFNFSITGETSFKIFYSDDDRNLTVTQVAFDEDGQMEKTMKTFKNVEFGIPIDYFDSI